MRHDNDTMLKVMRVNLAMRESKFGKTGFTQTCARKCQHVMCRVVESLVSEPCIVCHKSIGWETPFVFASWPDLQKRPELIHRKCIRNEIKSRERKVARGQDRRRTNPQAQDSTRNGDAAPT